MTRRTASEDERRLFERAFREGGPIKPVASGKPAKKKSTSSGPGGINGATQERLRRGLIEPDMRIDLHGMTQTAAYRALSGRLISAHKSGHRLILVITGKGNPGKGEDAPWMASPHGVLKQMVPRWLGEAELAARIASVRPAHAKHGGAGALYVYLRKKA